MQKIFDFRNEKLTKLTNFIQIIHFWCPYKAKLFKGAYFAEVPAGLIYKRFMLGCFFRQGHDINRAFPSNMGINMGIGVPNERM